MLTQHYVFAHRAIPAVTFRDPKNTLGILCGPDAARFVEDLWNQAAHYCSPEGTRPSKGLSVEAGRAGEDGLVVMIRMPPPSEISEAHFVALVAKLATPESPSIARLASVRCFTLELGVDFRTEKPMTFLCEWAEDGKHYNHGQGPAASEDAFVEAIFNHLGQETAAAEA
jgi:hypothetical protein